MDVPRRDALKTMASAALAIGATPLLQACSGAVRDSTQREVDARAGAVGLDPVFADVLYHASLAPSGAYWSGAVSPARGLRLSLS